MSSVRTRKSALFRLRLWLYFRDISSNWYKINRILTKILKLHIFLRNSKSFQHIAVYKFFLIFLLNLKKKHFSLNIVLVNNITMLVRRKIIRLPEMVAQALSLNLRPIIRWAIGLTLMMITMTDQYGILFLIETPIEVLRFNSTWAMI